MILDQMVHGWCFDCDRETFVFPVAQQRNGQALYRCAPCQCLTVDESPLTLEE